MEEEATGEAMEEEAVKVAIAEEAEDLLSETEVLPPSKRGRKLMLQLSLWEGEATELPGLTTSSCSFPARILGTK